MKIPRITVMTLGVSDLEESTRFYGDVLGTPPNTSYEGVTFIELPGTWLSLYPIDALAKDISEKIPLNRNGFSGFTMAHNARNRKEVRDIMARARSAGARILKKPQETFWGGFSGYFADPDGYIWEVAWGPMFGFSENGELQFIEKE